MNTPSSSPRIGAPREGFTAYYAKVLNVAIPVDEVGDEACRIIVARRYVHEALIGLHQSKVNVGVLSAQLVGRN